MPRATLSPVRLLLRFGRSAVCIDAPADSSPFDAPGPRTRVSKALLDRLELAATTAGVDVGRVTDTRLMLYTSRTVSRDELTRRARAWLVAAGHEVRREDEEW